MKNTSAANITLENGTASSITAVPSKAEGIALCSAFMLTSVLIVAGNLLTIVLFAMNKTLRKKSLFLAINLAFADLVLGSVSLPIFIYEVGSYYKLWTDGTGGLWNNKSFSTFYMIVDTAFSQASLISAAFISCERFYAIYWPLKHRTLSTRAYRIVIFMAWILALLISAIWTGSNLLFSLKHSMFVWVPYTLILTIIICGCNVGIWRKFQQVSVASQQQNKAALNKRLTKTLLFVSVLALLSWLPLIVLNVLIAAFQVSIPWKFYYMVNVLNYSNSFVNPVVYALRIPEFRQALGLCCFRNHATRNRKLTERRSSMSVSLTVATELRLQSDPRHLQLSFEQEVMDTKL